MRQTIVVLEIPTGRHYTRFNNALDAIVLIKKRISRLLFVIPTIDVPDGLTGGMFVALIDESIERGEGINKNSFLKMLGGGIT
ncbi:MAG: hypothetical protein COA94_04950 [Rickettsiales bacterium]|nr:MAG: hypothetical protein COA94_04950 [Rickettsiales bacterium]